jgi:4-diphosphocytidyl-2-C-methyl-D-erythritol kinase
MKTICPAKINSFLSVGPPDRSGLHPLRTVFHAVSLADELTVETAAQDEFCSTWAGIPDDNTVTKAWRLAREYVEIPALRVSLTKRIPAESGLGGGSSDAAALLRLLAVVSRGRLASENLFEIALAVGADVPFFLVGGSALGEGYGERLTPLPDGPQRWLVIVRPPVGVSTALAYRGLDDLERNFLLFPEDLWSGHNDFMRVAPEESVRAVGFLRAQGADVAGLTGSGSAVYGAFQSEVAAQEARAQSEGLGESWVCRTLTREESLWTS